MRWKKINQKQNNEDDRDGKIELTQKERKRE